MFKQFISGCIERYGHQFVYSHNNINTNIFGLIINPYKKSENFKVTPIGIKKNVKNDTLTFVYYPDDNLDILQKNATLSFDNKVYKILKSDKMLIGKNLFYIYADIILIED